MAKLDFTTALEEIAAGRAQAHPSWVLLHGEHDRDNYALRPEVWQGSGEYQRVTHSDGRSVLVHIPFGSKLS